MDLFLNDIFSFPTLLFAFPFVILMLFWLLAFAGLVDLEVLDFDSDIESDGQPGDTTWLETLGLDGVPLTVVLTLIDLYGFALTYLAKKHILPIFDGILTATATGAIIAFLAVVIALPITMLTVKPLRKFFHTHEGAAKSELIGTLCSVTTQTVSEKFGQATTDDGMVLRVTAKTPNDLQKGSRVALLAYDRDLDSYSVVSEAELMAMSSDPTS